MKGILIAIYSRQLPAIIGYSSLTWLDYLRNCARDDSLL